MKKESVLIIVVAVMASLLEIIDASIVNVALPTMMGNLGATLEDISMVITGYAIANAIVLPVSAWLGERIGRRVYFLGCILLFTATSVACGLAPNLETLTLFRILQGLAGGALLPTSQTLIYEQFPKEKAGIAGAIFGMSVMIGPTLGPTMGGYLTDTFGWRSIFNINLPLGLIAFFIGAMVIFNVEKDPTQKHEKKELDIWGLTLLVLGIGCLQYVLERGEADDWFSSKVILFNTIVATISLPLFVWWELRVKNPIINVRLFLKPLVSNGVALMAMVGFFLYGVVFILPIFVSRTLHFDATQTGMLFIPGSLLTAALMPFVGRQMYKGTSPKMLILVGLLSLEVCLFLMTQLSPLSSEGEILRMLYVRGFGMAFIFVPINSSILSQFKGIEMGQVSGLLNLARQIGGSVGIALIGTLLNKNSHQNYLDLTSKVSLLNSNAQSAYYSTANGMAGKMSDGLGMATGSEAALRSLYGRIQNQVFMLSFKQLMFLMMIIFAVSFIPLYFLRYKEKTNVVVDSH
ncbi:DHA2 family efflux MFS transporter permease subunit [Bdellovibrio bacteriovorus]|uniref:DHA2 family efflux MFS transporter permease subunit n=1 Tax=Bdellovibrio bacteriovorus TaxID=959 RepID=UPI0035A62CD2